MRQLGAEVWTKWRELVSEQSHSGQTVKVFCSDRGLRDSLFYDWKKRLRESEAAKFVEVKVKESCKQEMPAPGHGPAIEIRLKKGRSLLVEPGFDANHLRTLLAVLETEV
jgi:hypothetical protein